MMEETILNFVIRHEKNLIHHGGDSDNDDIDANSFKFKAKQ